MSIDFDKLLKDRKTSAAERFEKIRSEAQKTSDFGKADERYWYPERDKAGNAYAVIRFLDAPAGEDAPWVRMWSHGFKGPNGMWYIENSRTTIGEPDPLAEYNSQLWNTGTEANKEIVRKQKRQLAYHSNIMVVSDPKHPENEGKVFLFKYGKRIHDKIKDKMSPPPEFPDEVPCNPFDFYTGANFKLKVRKVDGRTNYDKSEFDKPSALGTDDEIKDVFSRLYVLQPIVDVSQFKSYDELKARLAKVLDANKFAPAPRASDLHADDVIDYQKPETEPEVVSNNKNGEPTPAPDEDTDIDYFRNLAKDAGGDGEEDNTPF